MTYYTAAEKAIGAKQRERDAILALYRRGRIDDGALDAQLDDIERERGDLETRLGQLRDRLAGLRDAGAVLDQAELLLRELNERLDGPITWELKRDLIEILVASIVVEAVPGEGEAEALVNVTYRFERPSGTPTSTALSRSYRYGSEPS